MNTIPNFVLMRGFIKTFYITTRKIHRDIIKVATLLYDRRLRLRGSLFPTGGLPKWAEIVGFIKLFFFLYLATWNSPSSTWSDSEMCLQELGSFGSFGATNPMTTLQILGLCSPISMLTSAGCEVLNPEITSSPDSDPLSSIPLLPPELASAWGSYAGVAWTAPMSAPSAQASPKHALH